MNSIKKFGFLTSSIDPNKLATTVEGIIMGASVFIIYLAHKYGVEIGTAEVSIFAVQIGSIVATTMTLFGLIRKVIVFIGSLTKDEDITNEAPSVQVVKDSK